MNNSTDAYKTIPAISEGFYKEKGSKFLAFAIPCTSAEKAKEHINSLRKEHHNACHVCFAWRFGEQSHEDRYSDDGEPNNSAGKPIFGQILSFEITNVLIAVVRYYGGTNLGVGGLISAYKTASKEALENANIVTRFVMQKYYVQHEFKDTGTVMSILNKFEVEILSQGFENNLPLITFKIRQRDQDRIKLELGKNPGIILKRL